jgi:hypothetical protein
VSGLLPKKFLYTVISDLVAKGINPVSFCKLLFSLPLTLTYAHLRADLGVHARDSRKTGLPSSWKAVISNISSQPEEQKQDSEFVVI